MHFALAAVFGIGRRLGDAWHVEALLEVVAEGRYDTVWLLYIPVIGMSGIPCLSGCLLMPQRLVCSNCAAHQHVCCVFVFVVVDRSVRVATTVRSARSVSPSHVCVFLLKAWVDRSS